MPIQFEHVYLSAAGLYLPRSAIGNEEMNAFIAPINKISKRIQSRILAENGIKTRHYAIDAEGKTQQNHAQIAAAAVHHCLDLAHTSIEKVSLLAAGSSGGDALMPGFANMIQGELGAPPCKLFLAKAYVQRGAAPSNLPHKPLSLARINRHWRWPPKCHHAYLSKAVLLRVTIKAILTHIFCAGCYPMAQAPAQSGPQYQAQMDTPKEFFWGFPRLHAIGANGRSQPVIFRLRLIQREAEAAGALSLRQDIRMLPHLFDICIHAYVKLVDEGWITSNEIDHFLCHYSSAKFMPVVEELLAKAGLSIPPERIAI